MRARSAGGRQQQPLGLRRAQRARSVVEVERVDLVLARAAVGRGLDRAPHAVDVEREQRRVARVEGARVEPVAAQLELAPLQREAGGGRERVAHQAQALRRPGAVGRAVDLVRDDVQRLVDRELEHLEVARAGERADQEAQERDQDHEQRQHEVAEDPKLDPRPRRSRDALHHRLDLDEPLGGRHAEDELAQEHAVVLEERGDGLGERCRGGAVGGPHEVEHEARRLLAVLAGHLAHGIAHQHHVERHPHLVDELDGLAHRLRARVPPRRHVRPVLGVGVRDRVRDQHQLELGALRIRRGDLARLDEGAVEVGPLSVVAVAGRVVDGDLAPGTEQDQPVALALHEAEHLLERGHALGLRVERRQRGGVVHQEEDDGALARGAAATGRLGPASQDPREARAQTRAGSIAESRFYTGGRHPNRRVSPRLAR